MIDIFRRPIALGENQLDPAAYWSPAYIRAAQYSDESGTGHFISKQLPPARTERKQFVLHRFKQERQISKGPINR